MKMDLLINKVSCEKDDDLNYIQVAFSDNYDEPDNYVILQSSIEITEQDMDLEMTGCYLEINESLARGYDLCARVEFHENIITIYLRDEGVICLDIKEATADIEEIKEYLSIILKDKLVIL